jgi:glycosyltransferase involved in cell wall biosynthesis
MKIAFVGQKGIPATFGGIETHVEALAIQLARRGHHITVYVRSWYTPKRLHQYSGIRLRHLPTVHTKHLDAFLHSFTSSLHLLFLRDVDIVHYHGIGPAIFSWIPTLFKKRVVVTIHAQDWQSGKWGPIAIASLKLAERIAVAIPSQIIVVSRTLELYLKEKYQKNVAYIPNGAHSVLACPPRIITQKYALKQNGYILFMGRFVPQKRVEWAINAFKAVASVFRTNNIKLVLSGGSSATDQYVKDLHSQAKGIDNIICTGYVAGEEKNELFSNAYLFILPSYLEGSPIALLEAMSFGIPCLASDIPPHQEIITDGMNGYLFKCHHFDDLVCRLRAILLVNPVKLKELGEEGRDFVRANHNWSTIARQTEEVYYSVASGP